MLVNVIPIFFGLAEISIFGYFFYVTTYNLILSVAGHKKLADPIKASGARRKYLIIIPAFKEDLVIEQTVNASLNLNYPKSHFKVLVIADSFEEDTLSRLQALPITVVPYSTQNPTKVKAIRYALGTIQESYDSMVILDADNHIDPDFLSIADELFEKGYSNVQGRRMTKNPDSDMAYLDGLSEAINTHINRKGCFNLGLSASIAGSGFVVDFQLGKAVFYSLESVGGFDKDFELQLNLKNFRAAYSDQLVVYDEKVETSKTFRNQRKRWVSSQYVFLRKNFYVGLSSLIHGKFLMFNTVILRNLQLPRLLNLGMFIVITIAVFFLSDHLLIQLFYWSLLLCFFIISILISIPQTYYNKRLFICFIKMPMIFLIMFILMFRLKGANKKFIHTPHGSNS